LCHTRGLLTPSQCSSLLRSSGNAPHSFVLRAASRPGSYGRSGATAIGRLGNTSVDPAAPATRNRHPSPPSVSSVRRTRDDSTTARPWDAGDRRALGVSSLGAAGRSGSRPDDSLPLPRSRIRQSPPAAGGITDPSRPMGAGTPCPVTGSRHRPIRASTGSLGPQPPTRHTKDISSSAQGPLSDMHMSTCVHMSTCAYRNI